MYEWISSPIGLMQGVINGSTYRVGVQAAFGFKCEALEQAGYYRKIHSPIQVRSPPLIT